MPRDDNTVLTSNSLVFLFISISYDKNFTLELFLGGVGISLYNAVWVISKFVRDRFSLQVVFCSFYLVTNLRWLLSGGLGDLVFISFTPAPMHGRSYYSQVIGEISYSHIHAGGKAILLASSGVMT